MSETLNILVLGSVMVDTIAVIEDDDIERITMHNATSSFLLLEQGRKVEAERIRTHIGGGAVNTAVAMSRLGHQVDIFGVVGDDSNGAISRSFLKNEGINTDNLLADKEQNTGTSVIVSSHDHNAAIFTSRGANTTLNRNHLTGLDFNKYDLVYIASLSGNSSNCFVPIVKKARLSNCFIATNPGIKQLTNPSIEFLTSLREVDLLCVNQVELEAFGNTSYNFNLNHILSRKLPEIASTIVAEENLQIIANARRLLHSIGLISSAIPKNLSVTCGLEGSFFLNDKYFYHTPIHQVEPLGTTGAGDAFNSTLSTYLCLNHPLPSSLAIAAVNAGSVVKHVDTTTGLLTEEECQTLNSNTCFERNIINLLNR